MMSIKPEWCEKIASGKITIVVRKIRPKSKPPFKVYIYCANGGRLLYKSGYNNQIHIWQAKEHKTTRETLETNGNHVFNGKVIGEFVCDRIEEWDSEYWNDDSVYQAISRIDYDYEGDYELVNIASNEDDNPSNNYLCKESCLSFEEIQRYVGNNRFYAWHISDLVIYDKPKKLNLSIVALNSVERKSK